MRIGVVWVGLTSRNTTLASTSASTQVSAFYESSPAMIIIMCPLSVYVVYKLMQDLKCTVFFFCRVLHYNFNDTSS